MLSNDETYYTLIGLASEETNLDIVIRSTYNNLPVKKIGEKAFKNCQNVNSVIVPDSVIEIGGFAFQNCSLKSISLPNAIGTITAQCFAYTDLKTIDIPDSVKTIASDAFRDCHSLTSVNMANSVEVIMSCAFCYCNNLSSITLSNKLTTLPFEIFNGTAISSFVIGRNITSIESNAFSNCANLKSVIFEDPNNWTYNGESINVNDSELNAYLLSKTYNENTWYKYTEA